MDIPSSPTGAKAGPLTKLLLKIAAVDQETLLRCPPRDWDNARAVAEIMLCTWLYQAALFSLIGHRLFAASGQVRVQLVVVAMFLATFIMLIDSYMVMRSGWQLSGITELKRGGLDISCGWGVRIKAAIFLATRILLSIGIAQLTAIFFALLVFATDIAARVEHTYQQTNAGLIAHATTLVDAEVQQARDAVATQSARVSGLATQLTALRQNAIDPAANDAEMQPVQQEVTELLARHSKADDEFRRAETVASNEFGGSRGEGFSGHPGDGPRHKADLEQVAAAKNHLHEIDVALTAARARLDALRQQHSAVNEAKRQSAHDQLPDFEQDQAAEDDKLSSLKEQLTTLTRGRDDAIRQAVEHAPDYVARNGGFLAQIVALEQIAQADNKIAAVILLIDVTSFGFELAAVLAKVTSFVPTTYAALLARDAYLQAVRLVDAMTAELNAEPQKAKEPEVPSQSAPANDNHRGNGRVPGPDPFAGFDDPPPSPPQPPKRPRGRPRKSGLNGDG